MDTVVFGRGMMGQALSLQIPGEIEFMDNRDGNVEETVAKKPGRIVLGVLDAERQAQMKEQLKALGYEGEIICYPQLFDVRIATMRLIARSLPDGDIAELGVYRGDFAAELAAAMPGRRMHLFDSFEGFDGLFKDTSEEFVQSRLPDAVIHKGFFPGTFEAHDYAFVSLDPDLYEPVRDGLELFWPCLVSKGVIMIHDYNSAQFPGVKKAADEFCGARGLPLIPVADLHGSVILQKQ